jgi:hypothetical protein
MSLAFFCKPLLELSILGLERIEKRIGEVDLVEPDVSDAHLRCILRD